MAAFFEWFERNQGKTFRPLRQHTGGTLRLHRLSRRTLGTGYLRDAVTLPPGEDKREWISALTIDFFNDVNLVYGMIAECCTPSCCPIMSAGPKVQYKWADGKTYKQPVAVSAPEYMRLLWQWVQSCLDDERLFPTAPGVPFPADFMEQVRNIYKRLFRVYAHIFHDHYEKVQSLTFESHLNTCFKHFMYFVLEFELIPKEELQPLRELIDFLLAEDRKKHSTSTTS